jgi:hypothetical protein
MNTPHPTPACNRLVKRLRGTASILLEIKRVQTLKVNLQHKYSAGTEPMKIN